jgi:hypothetical protein
MESDQYQVSVRDRAGRIISCQVMVSDVCDDISVTLEVDEVTFSEKATDAFEAFSRIRASMAELGITPLCYGASRNVFPSGMSRSIGGGIKAYRLTTGKQALLKDLVCIFDTGPDTEPASPQEQKAYFESWLSSLGKS